MTEDDYKSIVVRDVFNCQQCGMTVNYDNCQLAHRIKSGSGSVKYIENYLQSKQIYKSKKFIQDTILSHPDNLVTTCSLKCNDKCNIFFNPVKRDELLENILKKVLTI